MVSGVGHERERESSHHLGSWVDFDCVLDAAFLEWSDVSVRARNSIHFGFDAKPFALSGRAFAVAPKKFCEWLERSMVMGLLERVSTLIRANLNDMVDRAEDPEKMIKQVILDMENQYLQVKTQVAVSIADQHMLEKKLHENEDTGKDWMRKAELAVDKKQDDLARAALDRYQTSQRLAESYREQVADQKAQVEALKGALQKLEQKLDEAKSKRDLLLARHRRSVALGKAARAQTVLGDNSNSATFDRLKDRVHHTEAVASAEVELLTDDVHKKLSRLDRDNEIERLLTDLKARRGLPA
jgi:phage shock protein A